MRTLTSHSTSLSAPRPPYILPLPQVNEFKYEIERLTRELQDVKRKYYEQKRKDQLMTEIENEESGLNRAQAQAQAQLQQAQGATTRFAGGGFAIR